MHVRIDLQNEELARQVDELYRQCLEEMLAVMRKYEEKLRDYPSFTQLKNFIESSIKSMRQ